VSKGLNLGWILTTSTTATIYNQRLSEKIRQFLCQKESTKFYLPNEKNGQPLWLSERVMRK
jgi:hypothetical protein